MAGERRIQKAWESYRKQVMDRDAPDIQVTECRLAFFAGASATFSELVIRLERGQAPNPEDLQKVYDIQAELQGFRDAVTMAAAGIRSKYRN